MHTCPSLSSEHTFICGAARGKNRNAWLYCSWWRGSVSKTCTPHNVPGEIDVFVIHLLQSCKKKTNKKNRRLMQIEKPSQAGSQNNRRRTSLLLFCTSVLEEYLRFVLWLTLRSNECTECDSCFLEWVSVYWPFLVSLQKWEQFKAFFCLVSFF